MSTISALGSWPARSILTPAILLLSLALLAGCGGGGGDGEETASAGTASGHLIVPPNYGREDEPNETLSAAQELAASAVISGTVSAADPGFTPPGQSFTIGDLYRIQTSEPLNASLTIAADDLDLNDLDLILLNSLGVVIDSSEGYTSTEFMEIPAGALFYLGVRAFKGASAYVLSLTSSTDTALIPAAARFVPGEILVKWRPEGKLAAARPMGIAAARGLETEASFPEGVDLLKIPAPADGRLRPQAAGKLSLPGSEVRALQALTLEHLRRLAGDPAVTYAEPNFLRRSARVPNDPSFDLQWHYRLMNLPQAWDMATGTNEVTVAIIDTGVLLGHPDLGSRLIQGFDFIRDLQSANDGDGPDSDPDDPGDDPRGQSSSFHGTHVAGTAGAVTHNAVGVAGVTWQTRLMPLRALGVDGGADADIAQAIRYAAGLPNSSGTVPAERADLINMSFAGSGYSQTLEDAVRSARNQGVILVAAAGNSNSSAFQSPASLTGVVAVSAVDLNSQKAAYSNFGPYIDVAAPGGNTGADLNGDGYADGVLSTMGTDQGEYIYRFYQGTSMACAHMSGMAALMLAVNPNLTPADLDNLISGTHPDTTTRITRDLGEPGKDDLYGHGIIDAAQALIAAQEVPGGGATLPTGSILQVSTPSLHFDNFIGALSFEVTNAGIETLEVTSITDDAPWLILSRTSGTAPLTVSAAIDRTGLSQGSYTATIQVDSDATEGSTRALIQVEMEVGGKTMGDVGQVFILLLERGSLEAVAQAESDAGRSYVFETAAAEPGSYLVIAGTDRDDDGFICDIEDACGSLPEPVTIRAGQDTPGIAFVLGELASPQGGWPMQAVPERGPFPRLR
ncbi:MAG: S8 family peptidase [bacterium]